MCKLSCVDEFMLDQKNKNSIYEPWPKLCTRVQHTGTDISDRTEFDFHWQIVHNPEKCKSHAPVDPPLSEENDGAGQTD